MTGAMPEFDLVDYGPRRPDDGQFSLAVKDRRVWLATSLDGVLFAFRDTYPDAAKLARGWRGMVAELPIVADFRTDVPGHATLCWREEGQVGGTDTPPAGPVVIVLVGPGHDGQTEVTYREAEGT